MTTSCRSACRTRRLIVAYGGGRKRFVLDPHYTLGTPYRVTLVAARGRIEVSYNATPPPRSPGSGSGWYFTTGANLQSRPAPGDPGDPADAVEVVLYSATIRHDPARSAGRR